MNRLDVDVPARDVYAVLLDAYAYADWVVGSKRVRAVDASWPAPGSRFHHTVGAPGVDINDSSEMIDLEPDRRVELEVRFRPLGVATVTMELAETSGEKRTRITMTEVPKSGPARAWWSFVLDAVTYLRNAWSLRRLARLSRAHAQRRP